MPMTYAKLQGLQFLKTQLFDLIEFLKNIIFNANDLCMVCTFKDADGVISSQLRIDLGDNTF